MIQEKIKFENKNIQEISKKYIEYIKSLNHDKKSSSKNFYLIISYENKENKNPNEIAIEDLNDKYFKIKDCLSRCGNIVEDIKEKKQIIDILFSFLNFRLYFNNT